MFMANASLSNFFSCFVSIVTSVMSQTLTFHFAFVTARHRVVLTLWEHGFALRQNILVLSYCSPNGAICCSRIKHFRRQWLPPKRGLRKAVCWWVGQSGCLSRA